MAFGGNSDRLMSDINVTPFVDVMLVLLIIFMVTAPMMIQGVDVSLPEASSDPLPADTEQIMVTINNKNQIFINDFRVEYDFLGEKLEKIFQGRTDREVFLRADKEISYGFLIKVMAEIKGAGIEKLGMVTEPVVDTEKKDNPS